MDLPKSDSSHWRIRSESTLSPAKQPSGQTTVKGRNPPILAEDTDGHTDVCCSVSLMPINSNLQAVLNLIQNDFERIWPPSNQKYLRDVRMGPAQ